MFGGDLCEGPRFDPLIEFFDCNQHVGVALECPLRGPTRSSPQAANNKVTGMVWTSYEVDPMCIMGFSLPDVHMTQQCANRIPVGRCSPRGFLGQHGVPRHGYVLGAAFPARLRCTTALFGCAPSCRGLSRSQRSTWPTVSSQGNK